jgi:hypothetical protein
MNNSEILRKVALRELTPAQGADQMIQQDREARKRLRPRWVHPVAWLVLTLLAGVVLAACGVQRD